MNWSRTGLVLTAAAMAVVILLPGIGRTQDSEGGALPDIDRVLALPPYEGEQRESIAKALAEYADGDVERAWKEARSLARRQMARTEDKAAATAFIEFIDGLGVRALAAADRFIEAEQFRLASVVLDRTYDRFGRHKAGSEARAKLRDLKRNQKDRLEAQESLHEIEVLLLENEPARAKSRLARLEKRYPDLQETAAAQSLVARFDPAEGARREALKYSFGTVTSSEQTPGTLDCKGSCSRLVRGGYMKFDLSEHAAGTTFRSGVVRVYVEEWSGNHWRWLTHIPSDPTNSDHGTIFREIQAQATKFSGVITLRAPSGWLDVRLNPSAIDAINRALANPDPDHRWIAIAFGFE